LLTKIKNNKSLIISLALILVLVNFAFLPKVFAGSLINAQLVEEGGASNVNPMIVGDGQSLALAFTTVNATATNWSMSITFSGWTGSGGTGTVNTSQTISNTGCGGSSGLFGASYTGLPGTLAASGTTASNSYITISSSGGSNALSASTSYCTILTSTSAVTNPTTASSYSVTINDSVDSITVELNVLTAGANQYTVSATVAPTFTMALNATSDTFNPNNLSASSTTVTANGVKTTISTNAADGWFVWAEDLNNGLKSASTGVTIPSVASGSNYNFSTHTGTPGYGLGVTADNTTNYAYGGGTTGGALSNSTYYEIATNNAPAAGVQFYTYELANISATTPSGNDYTDTITEIGAGSF